MPTDKLPPSAPVDSKFDTTDWESATINPPLPPAKNTDNVDTLELDPPPALPEGHVEHVDHALTKSTPVDERRCPSRLRFEVGKVYASPTGIQVTYDGDPEGTNGVDCQMDKGHAGTHGGTLDARVAGQPSLIVDVPFRWDDRGNVVGN